MIVCLSNLRREALQVSTLTAQVADLNSQLQRSVPGANLKGRVAHASSRTNPGTVDLTRQRLEIMKCFSLSLSLCRTSKDSRSEKC